MARFLAIVIACSAALVAMELGARGTEPTGAIVVTVKGLHSDKGRVHLALFQKGKGFPKEIDKAFRKEMARIRKGEAKAFFDDAPYGEYAIALFHDEDNDGKLAYGALGIPKEGYGFSNDARGRFGPPSFDKARFKLDSAEKAVSIKVKYGWL